MEEATVGMEGMSVREPTVTPAVLRALLERMETNGIKELTMQDLYKHVVEVEANVRRERRDDDLLAAKVGGIDLDNHGTHDNSGSETEDSIMGVKDNNDASNDDINFDEIQSVNRLKGNMSDKSRTRLGPFGHPAYEKPDEGDAYDHIGSDSSDDNDDDGDSDSINEPESLRPRHGATPHTMKFSNGGMDAEPVFGPDLDGIPDINEPESHTWSIPKPAAAPEQPRAFDFDSKPPPPPPRTTESFNGGAFWGTGGGVSQLASALSPDNGVKGGKRKLKAPSSTPSSSSAERNNLFGDSNSEFESTGLSFGLPSHGDSPSSTDSTMEVADSGESPFTFNRMGSMGSTTISGSLSGSSLDAPDTLPVPPPGEPINDTDSTESGINANRYAAAAFSFGKAEEGDATSTPGALSAKSSSHPNAPTKDGPGHFNVGSGGKGPGGKSKHKRVGKKSEAGPRRSATGSENIAPTGLEAAFEEGRINDGGSAKEADTKKEDNALFSKQATSPASELERTLMSHERVGKEAYKANKYEESFQSFSKVLLMAPPKWTGRSRVLGNRAAAHMMAQKFVLAANDCESALAIDSSLVKLHVRRARCMLRLGMFTKTEEICSRVLTLDDDINGPKAKGDHDVDAAKRDARKCLRTCLPPGSSLRGCREQKQCLITIR